MTFRLKWGEPWVHGAEKGCGQPPKKHGPSCSGLLGNSGGRKAINELDSVGAIGSNSKGLIKGSQEQSRFLFYLI